MNDQTIIIEIALRGVASGVNLLLAGLIMRTGAPIMRRVAGALFLFGTVVYILISSDNHPPIIGGLTPALKPFAVFNTVFFWWFALSLFDDDFRLDQRTLWPAAVIGFLNYGAPIFLQSNFDQFLDRIRGVFVLGLISHALYIALKNRRDDLVDPRRRFRPVFAGAVGILAIIITTAELYLGHSESPAFASQLQAVTITGLSMAFAFWMLTTRETFFELPVQVTETSLMRGTAPSPILVKLEKAMDEGAYLEEGLTVARLAGRVGVPEHHLRKVINGQLGFRNFSAFLNERRVADAKSILSDPTHDQKQVLQIALDLGYGSVASFNRAFKRATSQTPTEFRKNR